MYRDIVRLLLSATGYWRILTLSYLMDAIKPHLMLGQTQLAFSLRFLERGVTCHLELSWQHCFAGARAAPD